MNNLFIFDGLTEELLAVASNDNSKKMSIHASEIVEELNKDFLFEFEVPMAHEDSRHIKNGNRVVFKDDQTGEFQEFQIYSTEEVRSSESMVHAYAEHTVYEIIDDIVTDLRITKGTAKDAMTKALSSSRWEVGTVAELGTGTVNFYYSNGMENLKKVQGVFGGELNYRVTLSADKTRIEGRFVDLLTRRGADTGKRSEFTKDITSIKRTVDETGVKTALYGRGNGEETEDNGYSRKITIENVLWRVEDGSPLDKPMGQEFLADPEALKRYGRNKGTRHRFGIVEVDSTDPNEIMLETYKQLMEVNKPRISYEVEAQDLALFGLEHEKVTLGDSIVIIDRMFKPELRVEARVVSLKRDPFTKKLMDLTLGNFIPVSTDLALELDELKAKFTDRKGVWDTVESLEVANISDSQIEDIVPKTPTGVVATGLFKSIAVEWDFEPSIHVANYEVYGSTTKGFTVDSSRLLFRGKTGGFVQKADTNQTWYFRIRAVNTHGRKSGLTAEFSASTNRITTPDFEDLSVTNAKIAELAVDEAKIADLAVTNAKIKELDVSKVNAGVLKAQFVEIGSKTVYENSSYNPASKATPQQVADAEARAKAVANSKATPEDVQAVKTIADGKASPTDVAKAEQRAKDVANSKATPEDVQAVLDVANSKATPQDVLNAEQRATAIANAKVDPKDLEDVKLLAEGKADPSDVNAVRIIAEAKATPAQIREAEERVTIIANSKATPSDVSSAEQRATAIANAKATPTQVAEAEARAKAVAESKATPTDVANAEKRATDIANSKATPTDVANAENRVKVIANSKATPEEVAEAEKRAKDLANTKATPTQVQQAEARATAVANSKATPTDVANAEARAKEFSASARESIFDPRFVYGQEFWSDKYSGNTLPSLTDGLVLNSDEAQYGGNVIDFGKTLWVYSLNPIPVNTSRVYQVTFRVKQKTNATDQNKSRVYAGVATLDNKLQPITTGIGTHRYCATGGTKITEADGWQTFTGLITGEGDDSHNVFRPGTKYVRPMFIVNYSGGDGIAEVDLLDFEDVTEIQELVQTVQEVSLRTTESSIISTVRESQEYEADMTSKANTTDLESYTTKDDLGQAVDELGNTIDEKIDAIDFSPYATTSEVEQTAEALDFKFSSSGGVNLLKNSVGYSGSDFWTMKTDLDSYGRPSGIFDTIQGGELDERGVGSGFMLDGVSLKQSISNLPQFHTLSFQVKKGSAGSGYVKISYDDRTEVVNFPVGTVYDYDKFQVIVEVESNAIEVELYGSGGSGIIFTGVMLNVGNVPLQWQHSAGELYNTNVLMDLNGIKVIASNYEGYTAITPEEFAGYAEVDGEMTRVFTLNKDVTEMSKVKVDKEISMSPIKIVPVKSSQYQGWAFVPE